MGAFIAIVVVIGVVVIVILVVWAYKSKHKPMEVLPRHIDINNPPDPNRKVVRVRATPDGLDEALSGYTSQGWEIVDADPGPEEERIFTSCNWIVILRKNDTNTKQNQDQDKADEEKTEL
ncbi:MAG: hypothetical protein LUD48_00770 [Prevotella sp.]|nr:hypothetical protein [Prevotella sp.]